MQNCQFRVYFLSTEISFMASPTTLLSRLPLCHAPSRKVFSEIKLKAKISQRGKATREREREGKRNASVFYGASFAYTFSSAFLPLLLSPLALLYLRWWHPRGPSAVTRCLRNAAPCAFHSLLDLSLSILLPCHSHSYSHSHSLSHSLPWLLLICLAISI